MRSAQANVERLQVLAACKVILAPFDGVVSESNTDVTIARDLGAEIEIGSGLNVDDRIVAAPPDGLVEGDAVRITGESPRIASGAAVKAGGS